jgi:hypothetical protein
VKLLYSFEVVMAMIRRKWSRQGIRQRLITRTYNSL